MKKRTQRSKSVNDGLKDIGNKRRKQTHSKEKVSMTGWNHVDFKKERFDFITEASDQVFTTTIFGRRSTPVKIFTHILSPEYSKKLIDQRASEHKELLTTSQV